MITGTKRTSPLMKAVIVAEYAVVLGLIGLDLNDLRGRQSDSPLALVVPPSVSKARVADLKPPHVFPRPDASPVQDRDQPTAFSTGRDLLKQHPALVQYVTAYFDSLVDQKYFLLYSRLNRSDEQIRAFRGIVRGAMVQNVPLDGGGMVALSLGDNAATDDEVRKQIEAAFGASALAEYSEVSRSSGVTQLLLKLNTDLAATSECLSPDATNGLRRLVEANSREFQAGGEASGYTLDWSSLLMASSTMMSPAQQKALERVARSYQVGNAIWEASRRSPPPHSP
jgi:hypothetical protein